MSQKRAGSRYSPHSARILNIDFDDIEARRKI
jgi:hypothetical protein